MQNYIVQEQKIDAEGNVLGDAFPITLTDAVFDGETKESLKAILNAMPKQWFGTQEQFDLISVKDNNTIYYIEEAQ